jgi:serine/threonine protein kinase
MGDFPPEWQWIRDLPEGGQAHTFGVRRTEGSDTNLYVLKRLKNPKREDYFEREIQACKTLDHPNVLRLLEHGHTPKGKPFLITGYCSEGIPGPERKIQSSRMVRQCLSWKLRAREGKRQSGCPIDKVPSRPHGVNS